MSARLIAAAALGLLVACGHDGGSGTAEGRAALEPVAAVPVQTALAGGGSPGSIEVPGTVEAARSASLASRTAAAILEIRVEEGARVRKGDLLVVLDGRDVTAAVAAAEARLAAARAQRDRIRSLLEKEAATRQEMETAEADFAAAASAVAAARSQLDYIEMRAPFDARVTARRMQAGDLASPGREILALDAAGLLRVAATVPGEQARELSVGQRVAAIFDGGSRAACVVSVINPAGDPGSRRFLLKCDLPPDAAARSGSFVRLELPGPSGGAASVAVPRAAVFERGGLTGVFVVQEGVARLRWIDAGAARDGSVIVRAGLAAGEEVILNPGNLADGTPVAAAREKPAP